MGKNEFIESEDWMDYFSHSIYPINRSAEKILDFWEDLKEEKITWEEIRRDENLQEMILGDIKPFLKTRRSLLPS